LSTLERDIIGFVLMALERHLVEIYEVVGNLEFFIRPRTMKAKVLYQNNWD
jgi:hypothetical protein